MESSEKKAICAIFCTQPLGNQYHTEGNLLEPPLGLCLIENSNDNFFFY